MQKLNLYYDLISSQGPVGNGLLPKFILYDKHISDMNVLRFPTLLAQLENHNVNFQIKTVADLPYNTSSNALNIYTIEPLNFKSYKKYNALTYMSEKSIKYINTGLLTLVIFYPLEGFDVIDVDFLSPTISNALDLKIRLDNMFVVFGNLKVRYNYVKAISKNDLFPLFPEKNIFPIDFFQGKYQNQIQHRWLNKDSLEKVKKKEYIAENNPALFDQKSHKFLSLNGNLRVHRVLAVSEMKRRNIFQYGKVSLLGRYKNSVSKNLEWVIELLNQNKRTSDEDDDIIYSFFINYIQDWSPILLDISPSELNEDDLQQDNHLYLDTYFSFVTETEIDIDILFLTEKIYKPIVNLHPFLVLGGQGTLQYLRNEGYHTFPEFFDELYDKEPNTRKRFKKVLDELERVCSLSHSQLQKLYIKAWPSLLHNRNLFLTKSHKNRYEKLFEQIQATKLQ